MARLLLLVLSLALGVAPGRVSGLDPNGTSEPLGVQPGAPTEDETLQNEADNQENVLSQVGWVRALQVGASAEAALADSARGEGSGSHLSACFLRGRDVSVLSVPGSSQVTESEKAEKKGESLKDLAQSYGK